MVFACENINFSLYERINILSLGCGIAPDLMAFESLLGRDFCYLGSIDNNQAQAATQAICTAARYDDVCFA